MTMPSDAAHPATVVSPGPAAAAGEGSWRQRLVRRRIGLSVVLFGGLIVLNFLQGHEPRDVLAVQRPAVAGGWVLVLLGLSLRSWAAGTLRKQRTLAVGGAYGLVRNPLYVGSFAMMIGFGLWVADPWIVPLLAGPVAWLYWRTVRSEEQRLAALFPQQWPAYVASVGRFVPRRLVLVPADWSLRQWAANREYQAWLGSAAAVVALKLWQMWW
jgi:protein-S-isoprenylcysteine O-methyltransferase Ste14